MAKYFNKTGYLSTGEWVTKWEACMQGNTIHPQKGTTYGARPRHGWDLHASSSVTEDKLNKLLTIWSHLYDMWERQTYGHGRQQWLNMVWGATWPGEWLMKWGADGPGGRVRLCLGRSARRVWVSLVWNSSVHKKSPSCSRGQRSSSITSVTISAPVLR